MLSIKQKMRLKSGLKRPGALSIMLLWLVFSITSVLASPPVRSITGKVIDEFGSTIPGANIMVKGSTTGAISDMDGKFTLQLPDGAKEIEVTFVGMKKKTVTIGTASSYTITLESNVVGLEEVVAIGYGVARKSDVTSSIATLKKDDFVATPVVNSPLQMIQGKLPGVSIVRPNGSDPTKGVDVQIRGISTLEAGKEPLIVIDGIVGGNLSNLSPNDIESFDVLRDGSSAAIYGSRGTNGVIIITTKKGVKGRTFVEYSGTVSTDLVSKMPDIMNADEWRALKQQLTNTTTYTGAGYHSITPDYVGKNMADGGASTDWFSEIMRESNISHQHYVSFNTATDKSSTVASVNYRKNEGIVRRSVQEIVTGRLRTDMKALNDKLDINYSMNYTYRKGQPVDYTAFQQAMMWNPTTPVFDKNGNYSLPPDVQRFVNPVNMIDEYTNDVINNEFQGSVKAILELYKGLKFSTSFSVEANSKNDKKYESHLAWASTEKTRSGFGSIKSSQEMNKTFDMALNYNRSILGKHSIEALGGYSYQDFNNEWVSAANGDFVFNSIGYNDLGSGLGVKNNRPDVGLDSYASVYKLISFFGRAFYSYDSKYLASFSARYEGSDNFGENHRWGFFPSVSLGWRISKEGFLKDADWVDDLKLRLGYGETGNFFTTPYISMQSFGQVGSTSYALINNKWTPAYKVAQNPNPNLKWESKAEYNIGVDYTGLKGRIGFNLDLYQRTTKDLIDDYAVNPPEYQVNTLYANVGSIENKGIELGINGTPVKTRDFSLQMNLNFSYNQNEVVSLSNNLFQKGYWDYQNIGVPLVMSSMRMEVGKPLANFYGYKFVRFDEKGRPLVEGKSPITKNDTALYFNDARKDETNRKIIGNGLPKYNSSLSMTMKYRNFDASLLLRGAFGFDILNEGRMLYETGIFRDTQNAYKGAKDFAYWDEPFYSDYWLEKGDYVKLDNVTIGYTYNSKSSYMSKLRVYATANNLLTITKYKGMDPELSINGNAAGYDGRSAYPRTRTFTVGMNVTF